MKLLETPHLLTPVPESGLAVTESFSLPDVDTTAMKLAALLFMEQDVSIQSLDAFYTAAGNFQCYQFENRISPSANVHALLVLVLKAEQTGSLTSRSQTQFVAGLEYLLAELADTDHLVDKWNLSDIYATCHAIELFIHIGESFVLEKIPRTTRYLMYAKTLEMLQYILAQLSPDGGWGDAGFSTLEETAYAVRAMVKAHLAGIIDIRPLIEGARLYLNYHQPTEDIPLWIGKSLYKSQVITRALQLSALAWLDSLDTQRTANNAHTSSSNHSRPQYFGGV
jgi:hypothetical protein